MSTKVSKTIGSKSDDKAQALQAALGQIQKAHGQGSIMSLGEEAARAKDVKVIPTGALSLDIALGGGVPRGRITEVFGPEGSGKTTLTLHLIAQVQKQGGVAVFIDAEHALDPKYAERIGVKLDDLLISQPENGEQALEITETLVRSNAVDLIVIDSVAALVPKAELDGDMGAHHVGAQARLMSQAMRKLTAIVSRTSTSVVFINQLREKIGVMFGNPEVTTGGRALKFYASVRIDVRKKDAIKEGLVVTGNLVKAKIVKNKVFPPFREAEFNIMYEEGISFESSVIDLGEKLGVLSKSGAWYNYGELRLGNGKEGVRKFLKENPEVCEDIAQRVREISFEHSDRNVPAAAATPVEEDDEDGVAEFDFETVAEAAV